jgi:23S rRNA pseudouridine1911/1915/1917 synthase
VRPSRRPEPEVVDRVKLLTVEPGQAGMRLDAFVAERCTGITRSQIERLARSGQVLVEGRPARPGRRLAAGEGVQVRLPAERGGRLTPEPSDLHILFEDEHLLVVNKPQGMVVHPGAGRTGGTLVNALLAHTGSLAAGRGPHRPGIVHRLDRDTSGLLAVAKSDEAYRELSRQVARRELNRRYLALVWGKLREDRIVINIPIGRRLRDRQRMAAVPHPQEENRVRSAGTDVRVLERRGPITLVEAQLATGRTHQIRVHLTHTGHPVVGDRVYGLRRARKEKATLDAETLARVAALPGQALHAQTLSLRHPVTGQTVSFSVPPPREMAELLAHLRREFA